MAQELLNQLKNKQAQFADVIAYIDERFTHTPTAFQNGEQSNAITENQGSAKVFTFAHFHKLNKEDTLALFAEHYQRVLASPNGQDHQNIRQFIIHGWDALRFDGTALAQKHA